MLNHAWHGASLSRPPHQVLLVARAALYLRADVHVSAGLVWHVASALDVGRRATGDACIHDPRPRLWSVPVVVTIGSIGDPFVRCWSMGWPV